MTGIELVRDDGDTSFSYLQFSNLASALSFFLDSSAVHAAIIVVAADAACKHQFTLSRRRMYVRPGMRAPGRYVSGARVRKTFQVISPCVSKC
jgi:uncharacterized membrane protein